MSLIAKLIFIFATMNAGKTTYLLQIAFNNAENNIPTTLFTSKIDDRYGIGIAHSRSGLKQKANTYDHNFSFMEYYKKNPHIKYILIDEGQFLSEDQVLELMEIVHAKNVSVIVTGLRTDFKGNTFPGSKKLLAIADELIEIKSICPCGAQATMNIRTIKNNQQILIGGNNMYKSACYKCFLQHQNKMQQA
ncbi:MAG: thymidine kinase [Pseudomonadota bacterium]